MCGFVGLWRDPGLANFYDLHHSASAMASALSHRGPDDAGVWAEPSAGLALAHQRLAILDLTSAGHQPMASADGRFVIAFNGEIYNHLDLRRELKQDWRGHSDTETLLAAIEAWGLEGALQRCAGMFALALWDRQERLLQLARDRFGEKPLYWGWLEQAGQRVLVFASELAAIRAHPRFNNSINRSVLAQFFRFGCISAPNSIYSNIYQLKPGFMLDIHSSLVDQVPQPRSWWSFKSLVADNQACQITDANEAVAAIEAALLSSICSQTLSDVPIGSFLSGGIDSSLITALLQSKFNKPIRTFTVGFEESEFNEAPYARSVSGFLGTDHSEVILTSRDAISLVPSLPRMYSEPFADSSQISTHLVCKEAKNSGISVALSGDGGDELFGGYKHYFWRYKYWNYFSNLPFSLRSIIGSFLDSSPAFASDAIGCALSVSQCAQKVNEFASRLKYVKDEDDLYCSLVSYWLDPASLLQPFQGSLSCVESGSPLDEVLPSCLNTNYVARMMAFDSLNYLPNDILTKVDRASMAVGLEIRSPFLDYRLAELAWRLPMSMKLGSSRTGASSKWILRQILYRYVPRDLVERPKSGFRIPLGRWLRGSLRAWADNLLDPALIRQQGFLKPEPIRLLWSQHLSGRFDHTARLWTILMWQAWLVEWG